MKKQILWQGMRSIQSLLGYTGLAFFLFACTLLTESCRIKEGARLTTVYGKVTDQAGLPVDSVTIVFAGTKGFSAGFPIKKTLTDSTGEYELVADVPREYHSASINLSFERPELLDKYLEFLLYENGIQKGNCCIVTMGRKNKYDFVLLPK